MDSYYWEVYSQKGFPMKLAQQVTEHIYWIGSNDWKTERFENLFPLPNGVTYNSYFIDDEKTAIIDTVDESIRREFFENVIKLLDGRQLDYLVINHMEPDHGAGIMELERLYPNIKIIGTATTFRMCQQFFNNDFKNNQIVVKDGDITDLGKHKLVTYTMPMVHWPEVTATYESTTGTLFSADAFGSFGVLHGNIFADQIDFKSEFEDEARRYYTNIVGKYGPQVQNAIKKLSSLKINTIASLHGPIWRTPETVQYILEKYMYWSTYNAEEQGVVIAFGSMYGNTANMAQHLAKLLALRGINNIKMYDVSKTDPSYIISDAWKYSNLVCVSPTYNLNLYLSMEKFLHELSALNFANHHASIVGNHTWASAAAKRMVELFTNDFKNVDIVGEVLDIKSALHEADYPKFEALADAIAESVKTTEIQNF